MKHPIGLPGLVAVLLVALLLFRTMRESMAEGLRGVGLPVWWWGLFLVAIFAVGVLRIGQGFDIFH